MLYEVWTVLTAMNRFYVWTQHFIIIIISRKINSYEAVNIIIFLKKMHFYLLFPKYLQTLYSNAIWLILNHLIATTFVNRNWSPIKIVFYYINQTT